jgi:hypothetical protein
MCSTETVLGGGEKSNNKETWLEGWDQSGREATTKDSFYFFMHSSFETLLLLGIWTLCGY